MDSIIESFTKPAEVWHLLVLMIFAGITIRGVERRLDNVWNRLSQIRQRLDPRQDD